MSAPGPNLFTIPAHRSFADALAAGLMAQHGRNPVALARGIVLLPNQRAARAVRDAFVRASGGGLLLPRLMPVGDPELDEKIGGMLDPLDGEPIPPAIEPIERQMRLARLVARERGVDAAEAMRLAADLGRTLDQLIVEDVPAGKLREIAFETGDLAEHWQTSLGALDAILTAWPKELERLGRIDLATRRNLLLAALERRWRERPPADFVCAAGVTTSAPAAARLLRRVARLAAGSVVFPALDLNMPDAEWDMLGPHIAEPGLRAPPNLETHPQFHLKLLLTNMGYVRGDVTRWRWGGGHAATAARGRAIGNAMAPAVATARWNGLKASERRLTGVKALELTDPAEEAQAIALALREALEEPGKTAALVTPDRALARRVTAHLARWGIEADDSAGRPLSQTPPGTLLLAVASAAAERFAPVALLTLLGHPLVRAGEARLDWLDGFRLLDRALRGPRPAPGLAGVSAHLGEGDWREKLIREPAQFFWEEASALLAPLEAAFDRADGALWEKREESGLGRLIALVRETATSLCGDELWRGPAGRAAAELIAALEEAAEHGPEQARPEALPALLEQAMAAVAVRPPYGKHPRLFIWGLIEARLQQADLMVLGGLNEGVWPALPAPDPWLAPRIRAELGLPSLERRIGLAAHDFACGLGAPRVLVTRSRRDARAPAVASRLWLRIEAMTGGVTRALPLAKWARAIDRPAPSELEEIERPAPSPPVEERPRKLSVTEVDRLKADPFAFYARRVLGLNQLDAVDADPSAAWRGSAVHKVLEDWLNEDGCDPAKLTPRVERLLDDPGVHPMLRALWQPRLIEAIDWVGKKMAEGRAEGRVPLAAEKAGSAQVAGVRLSGTVDRFDRDADGGLAIVDYKTGKPPSLAATRGGFSLQLGLLGLIAELGGFEDVEGRASCFEYWSLSKKAGTFGFVESPVDPKRRDHIPADEFVAFAESEFKQAVELWLTGGEPFTAKLHPQYAPYGEFDQLMRLDEWYGR